MQVVFKRYPTIVIPDKYLKRIRYTALHAVVEERGWVYNGRYGDVAYVYRQGEDENTDIIVPKTENIGDYEETVAELVRQVARMSDGNELGVWNDMCDRSKIDWYEDWNAEERVEGKTGERARVSGRYVPDDGGTPVYLSEGERFPPSSERHGVTWTKDG